ncbi:MAG: hypothetical protein ACN4GF_01585 [Lentimonas sp.]
MDVEQLYVGASLVTPADTSCTHAGFTSEAPTINSKKTIVILALIFAAGILSTQAKPAWSNSPNATVPQGSSKTDLESALFNLNLHQQQPDSINELYRKAWKILSEDK